MWVDGTRTFSEEGMRYRTVADLRIDGIFFSTFFGGADPSWAPSPTSMPTSPLRGLRPADRVRLTHMTTSTAVRTVRTASPLEWTPHMRISVIGCGYLGAVHAASMAELGHDVVGIDVDQRKVATLGQAGRRSSSRGSRSCWSGPWPPDG